ncbi:hypothetical protein PENANT_c012G05937 [Penicillium antarcticum]|uniref:Uncharacterized protein n=1 Tax=Penicillium antarcticum TaxID=416450 RepID=A0A1V6Q674_9EURO|nr:uncharacterized protein N7508_008170 [Penicillium antarcticum]KAJ5297921.1 hypothetical protein N7508_008170 [Penicillium antarcticum]OQD84728.1 hypothetical protein PENANT_c012G05937 [Penicillium antarcticum]
MSLDNPKRYRNTGPPHPIDADTYKEVSVTSPLRSHPPPPPTIESSTSDCTLQVNHEDCTLELSDRSLNLELNGMPNEKQVETDIEKEAVDLAEQNESGRQRAGTANGNGNSRPYSESLTETGTVKRHRKSHRRQWIIAGAVLGVLVLLTVIIVPSAIYGTRETQARNRAQAQANQVGIGFA